MVVRLPGEANDAIQNAISTALKKSEALVVHGIRESVAAGVSPDGKPLKALAHARHNGSRSPLNNTGQLVASVVASSTSTTLTVGTSRVGAALHQNGGEIRPVNCKYLCIPATLEAERAGSPRMMDLHPRINSKTGRGVMLDADGVVHFYMTTGPIIVPARPFIGFSTKTLAEVAQAVTTAIAKAVVGEPQ